MSNATLAVYSRKFIDFINNNQTNSDQLRMETRTRKSQKIRQKRSFSVGRFNARELTEDAKKEQLVRDVNQYDIDACTLQEIKIENAGIHRFNGSMIITFDSKNKHYGNGFIIPKK